MEQVQKEVEVIWWKDAMIVFYGRLVQVAGGWGCVEVKFLFLLYSMNNGLALSPFLLFSHGCQWRRSPPGAWPLANPLWKAGDAKDGQQTNTGTLKMQKMAVKSTLKHWRCRRWPLNLHWDTVDAEDGCRTHTGTLEMQKMASEPALGHCGCKRWLANLHWNSVDAEDGRWTHT